MAQSIGLTKVLQVRENEKKNALVAYNQSIEKFEAVATKLYQLLRKKEDAEDSYESYIKNTTPIETIIEQMAYVESLNKQIVMLQQQVNKARANMEAKQVQLTETHVEVKKFEKLIETRKMEQKEMALKYEQAVMDEISIQQFLSKN